MSTLIGNPAPAFDLACTRIIDPARGRVSLGDYRGRWLILVFYPHDFSLVCPTELVGLSQRFEEFGDHRCDLLGVSGDAVESHERWIATPRAQGGLGGLNFPLASDTDGATARSYGVYHEGLGVVMRGLFIVDPGGVVQYQVVHNLSVGRRSQEVLRVLQALQSGGLCREDWMADDPALDPFTAVRPGRYFSRYFIEDEVGSGTFARVFRARDLQLDRPVALKVFKPDCPVTPSVALAEARAAAALNHPNVCTIYTVDDTAGVPIIAMEYVAGRPMGQVAGGARLSPESLHSIARQLAAGMAAAHAAGIVHGDLKPENVMVADDGLVKILDFGLARRLRGKPPAVDDDTAELGLAELGQGLFGTPRYLAPEQVRGEAASTASDVFSLGVILFELATGQTAFPGPNLLQVLDQIRSVEPEALAARVPEPFAALLRAVLIADPARRSITMREVAEALAGPTEAGSPMLAFDIPPAVV
jgi:alkyl hydroperoxide reductase subunit AhpC/predicted Ser/Thr protein kinase